MSYPLSSDVSAGDPTSASHYNNLRSDVLRFGQAAANAVNVGSLMEWFESRLKLERLSTNRVRVPCSSTEPVGLIVAGYPLRSTANIDLAVGDVPTGGAQTWYVFANQTAGSTTFTLSINVSSSEGAAQRRIGRFYFDGTNIVKDSVRTELSLLISQLLYFKEPQVQCGRLTLSTNIPVPDSDVASSSVLYFTPYKGNRASLYVPNYGWRVYEFSELSIDISGWTTNKNYDVFLYDNAGSLAIEGLVWSNDTLRATALVLQDGAYVKTGALDRLYLGTIRTSGAGTSADSVLKRFVWNNYNRAIRKFLVTESTDTWTYATAAWRRWNNNAANQVEFVTGLSEEPVYLSFLGMAKNTAGSCAASIGIGLDNVAGSNTNIMPTIQPSAGLIGFADCIYSDFPGIGYHYLALLEYCTTPTTTFIGDIAIPTLYQSGAFGWINS